MGRFGLMLGFILWLAIGASLGAIVAVWLVVWAGAAYGANESFSLYSGCPLTRTTVALVAEEEWFWVSLFLTKLGWPTAAFGAMWGPGIVTYLADRASRHLRVKPAE